MIIRLIHAISFPRSCGICMKNHIKKVYVVKCDISNTVEVKNIWWICDECIDDKELISLKHSLRML